MSPRLLSRSTLNPRVLSAEYAVRGELVLRSMEYRNQIANGAKLPFSEIVACNIGNPQALNQQPISYFRQVVSCVLNPSLLKTPFVSHFKPDVVKRAEKILSSVPGNVGAYSDSQGLACVREDVARFISERDGYPACPDNIFITDGASPAVQRVLQLLIRDESDGIMIPLPQYPLYSASISVLGGSQVGYYLDEENNWGLTLSELKNSLSQAKAKGINTRAIAVINPGNPTGQCLSTDDMQDIIRFCKIEGLALLADEVYQENVYGPAHSWSSFKKVLSLMGDEYCTVPLFSFHSISKGFLGECGLRGGFVEMINVGEDFKAEYYKICSINLCSNTVGQLMMGLKVRPPVKGDASFETYEEEKNGILDSLKRRAVKLVRALNELEGVSCNDAQGAMYVFPRITLPPKAVAAAKAAGKQPDTFYCLELLDHTGIVVVPGSGFGQKDGTWHFRSTFLPSEEQIDSVIDHLARFHSQFMDKYRE